MFNDDDTTPDPAAAGEFAPPKRRTAWSAADLMAVHFHHPRTT